MQRSRSLLRRWIALGAALALGSLSAGALAQNYTVTINPTLNGLDVRFAYQADQDILVVTVTNNAETKVRCDFEYNAAPQFPFRTSVFVQPGRQAISPFRATRLWFSVVVDVTCVQVPE
jgi:hypothetical protein